MPGMPESKINLLGLSRQQMEAFLLTKGEKPFRAIQLLKWIHQFGVTDFDEMTNISKSLRAPIEGMCGGSPATGQGTSGCK